MISIIFLKIILFIFMIAIYFIFRWVYLDFKNVKSLQNFDNLALFEKFKFNMTFIGIATCMIIAVLTLLFFIIIIPFNNF